MKATKDIHTFSKTCGSGKDSGKDNLIDKQKLVYIFLCNINDIFHEIKNMAH